MIRIQGRAVVYGELWFDEPVPAGAAVDVLVHRYRSAPLTEAHTSVLNTLRTDLAPPAEAILATFEGSCRRQIRRAEREDSLRHELFSAPGPQLEEYAAAYDRFARQQGLWLVNRHWLARAAEAGQLTLSCAAHGGERLVWHALLRVGPTVQVVHSVSWFRGKDADLRALIGRANRWLHWQDMLAFRAAGTLHYDWGGMFADESAAERAGINHFKRTFGAAPVIAYEYWVPVTLRGRLWLTLRAALRRAPKRLRPEAASARTTSVTWGRARRSVS